MKEFYDIFNTEGKLFMFPPINIPVSQDDKYEKYIMGQTDKTLPYLSYSYYGNPEFFPILLYANQISDESEILDGTIIRIPFPDTTVLSQIRLEMELYKKLNY